MATNRFLIVGKYAVGSNRGLNDVDLVDTRVRGGGIKEEYITDFKGSYPQIRWFHDIGHYDGTPFPGATAVLVDLPASLLEVNGGVFNKKQIDSIVKHHLSFGIYPVIRFYCTNTGLIKHETVWDSTGAGRWIVSDDETCPDEDGTVLCLFETTTTTTTFECHGEIHADDMDALDTNFWALSDTGGTTSFTDGQWYLNFAVGGNSATLNTDNVVTIEGDVDICCAISVDTVHYLVDAEAVSVTSKLYVNDVFKGTSGQIELRIQTEAEEDPNPGQLKIRALGGASPEHMLTPPGGTGDGSYHIFRFVKDATANTGTFYVWNPSLGRWEWDGDEAGYVMSGWDANEIERVILTQGKTGSGTDDWIESGIDYFYVNEGIINIL